MYTDGACSGNPGPGGWGVYLIYKNHTKEVYGSELNTTNNRMELSAAIEGLKLLSGKCNVLLYTDSVYLQKGITEWVYNWQKSGWRTKSTNREVKNIDLWQELLSLVNKHDIQWHWVKGHSSSKGNQVADHLAVKGKVQAKNKLC